MKSFTDFLGRKNHQVRNNLETIGTILKHAGFRVENYSKEKGDPYIFVYKPDEFNSILEGLSFDGVRIYVRGKDVICYRPQNKEHVEPFGHAYLLDIKGMFKDMIGETHNKEKIGHEVAKFIIEELMDFFVQSAKAEKEERPDAQSADDKLGKVVIGGSANDYANQVTDPRNSRT